MRSLHSVSLCSTSVEMTYKEVPLLDSLPLIIKQIAICFLKYIEKYLMLKYLSKELPTYYPDQSKWGEFSPKIIYL